jgi:putative heme-binding domain-containing protein
MGYCPFPFATSFALNMVARRDAENAWTRTAILSSASAADGQVGLLEINSTGANVLNREVAALTAAEDRPGNVLLKLLSVAKSANQEYCYATLTGLGQGLARRRQKLSDRINDLSPENQENIRSKITEATHVASSNSPSLSLRTQAIELLASLPWREVDAAITACLTPIQSRDVQRTALKVIASFNEPSVAPELLSRWKQLTPPLRDEAVTILLSRPIWHEPLIAALEAGDVPISQVSIPQRSRLAAIKDEKLAERAKKILASFALGPRKEVLDRYQESLALNGNTTRGQLVYRRECLNCHRLRGEGHDVGPSLETVQHRSPQEILIHVLDPNREVSPNFLEYTVRLIDGRILMGLIAAETDSGLTLRRAQNQEDNVLRSEIEDITSSGKSLMPEGVEQKITPQEMADLIAYLRNVG